MLEALYCVEDLISILVKYIVIFQKHLNVHLSNYSTC